MKDADCRYREILDAAITLYETENYRDINIKEISKITSMSRPSIYNYFETKEEIFLSLLEEEYVAWADELSQLLLEDLVGEKEYLAEQLATSLAKRPLMLKLIANNIADFEENSRMERMVNFKAAYGKTLSVVTQLFEATLPDWSKGERQELLYAFFPYLYGLHAYTVGTKKQQEGMQLAGVDFHFYTVYELVFNLLKQLLQIRKEN